eukprot:1157651-Pelagomonas_calceolata.AAC.3
MGQCKWQISRPIMTNSDLHPQHPGWNKASSISNSSRSRGYILEEEVVSTGWLVRGQNVVHLPPAFTATSQAQQPASISVFCQHPGSAPLCQPIPSRLMISVHIDIASSTENNSAAFHMEDVPRIFLGHVHTVEVLVSDPYANRGGTRRSRAHPEQMGNINDFKSLDDNNSADFRMQQLDNSGQHANVPDQQDGLWTGRLVLVLWIIGVGWARDLAVRMSLPG